jgi:hypothetical protein
MRLIVTDPPTLLTSSLKVITSWVVEATPTALCAGEKVITEGGVVSPPPELAEEVVAFTTLEMLE